MPMNDVDFMMASSTVAWKRVWKLIDERRKAERWSYADLYKQTGVSETTYKKMRDSGQGIVRRDNREKVCDGLGWSRDSIDLILFGGDPEELRPAGATSDGDRVDWAALITQIAEGQRETARTLAAVSEQLARLLDRLPPE